MVEDNNKEIITPENVKLNFIIPEPSTRLAALIFDMMILWVVSGLVLLLAWLVLPASILWPSFFVFSFFFRLSYFIYYENKIDHATPGKRKLGLRVVNNNGLPVSTQSILIRNLAREIEISMPLQLVMPFFGFNTIAIGFFILWVTAIGFTTFTNRDRMRIGDLLAGTIIVKIENISIRADNYREQRSVIFQDQQLLYGVYELQTLASLLEQDASPVRDEKITRVAETIREKIGWPAEPANPESFLHAFYSAQRDLLERKKLFGEVRKDKNSTRQANSITDSSQPS